MSVDLPSPDQAVAVSIVVPVRNEADNIAPLIEEISAALDGRWAYEIIYVNDGSTDATAERLAAAMKQRANLRQLRHVKSTGQSAAVRSGVRAARSAIVATLDGDGQNNPAFLPDLIATLEKGGARVGLVAGQRVGRKDTGFKKLQSRVANAVRSAILHDGTRDTGCGLKAFRREVFLMMPYFDGLHRFLPALMRREGFEIAYVDVIDRPRRAGVSNYGFFDRLWIGILDLFGVWWLIRRKKPTPAVTEVT
jgi:dolichol-phosphate mannosyltransferase